MPCHTDCDDEQLPREAIQLVYYNWASRLKRFISIPTSHLLPFDSPGLPYVRRQLETVLRGILVVNGLQQRKVSRRHRM